MAGVVEGSEKNGIDADPSWQVSEPAPKPVE
jgi:hypothetical protein